MDYKQKYENALERCKKEFNFNNLAYSHEEIKQRLERVFPELKESEDEKIRKEIIQSIQDNMCVIHKDKCIAWLEKQGEHANFRNKIQIGDEITRNEDGVLVNLSQFKRMVKQGEQKPTNEVEPKFKVGDWVIDKQGIVHQINNVIENVTNHTYVYDIFGDGYFNDNTEGVRLWTIQDAKEGDVLTTDLVYFMFKSNNNDGVYMYCAYSVVSDVFNLSDTAIVDSNYVHPATKEQRDLLFQKMHEACYEWNAEKKELKKIEKPSEWGEEDELKMDTLIHVIANQKGSAIFEGLLPEELVNWLKSLKERMKGE